ncbi:MAG: prepilin-type N-terminal cleavage/methylation domain-containing protein [Deltaproteobacteria bacterium]|nr:prepilin-type N-terminal cleavage/methylation domain-containing protein [Deltaproteobacteria bacterium]MBW1976750.1 prepilin-type N-terminal cleavage/methylation domain-containing protein [Deltaproteobacteria bacterium]MBW2044136.1 prepilin-type N-terminal cleavage/methylation domain-containing protein [Deltaproteobacteria bacterium]MBW2299129.1 prepilin-type N-terminal cleavage/methylation domain-containing protein [Deltaproteobacteria bacterium]RLB35333.1 MAG: hypothetical protein DRH11_03
MNARNRHPFRDGHGFTLLEILIAIFILAIVLSLLYTSFTGTLHNIEQTETKADVYQMARVTLDRVVEDLECAFISSRSKHGFVGQAIETEGRHRDTLSFISRAHLVLDEEDPGQEITRISYTTGEGYEGQGLALFRSDAPLFLGKPEEEATGSMICDNLESLRFTYYDEKGEEFDSWDSTKEEFKDRLPTRVSILLEIVNKDDPESPLRFYTGVTLPMGRSAYAGAPKR